MMASLWCFISTLFFQISAIYFFGKLSEKKLNFKKKHILAICLVGIIQIILNLYEFFVVGPLFTMIYFLYLFKDIYNCDKSESQNYSMIIWTISIILDIITMLIMNNINIDVNVLSNNDLQIYKALSSIMMSTAIMLLANIKGFTKFLRKIYKKMLKLNIAIQYFIIIITIYIIMAIISRQNLDNRFVVIILLIAGLSILAIIIIFISQQYQIVTLKKTNEIIEENNQINIKIINQYRILKHNLESQLLGVKTVSNKKAKELIDNLILEYNSSFYIKHDINSMPSGINGLIYEKLYAYKDDNINLTINNKIKSKILPAVGARSYNLFCEALGVTLDNALDASKKSKDKIIYLEFRETKEKIIFKIMNTFKGKIDLDKLGTINYTSKSSGHGLGLFSLIGRKNLTITTSIKNDLFINSIEVNKEKK